MGIVLTRDPDDNAPAEFLRVFGGENLILPRKLV